MTLTRDKEDVDSAGAMQVDRLPSRELITDIYYKVSAPFRRVMRRIRWKLFPRTLATCAECGAAAQWCYGPCDGDGEDCYCDECVPRGCVCNIIQPRTESADPSSIETSKAVFCPAASMTSAAGVGRATSRRAGTLRATRSLRQQLD